MRRPILCVESAATAVSLAESAPLIEAASGAPTSRRFEVRVIEADIWGSSGYYSADVLREAATQNVFGEGTQVYLDHPSAVEAVDRPERSVRDLAGRLVTNAEMRDDGLYAEVEVFPHVAPVIEGMADAIGMSIRAMGTAEQGEAAGRKGTIITALTDAMSVDFVTAAGAGGKVTRLLESARALGTVATIREATANDVRDALSAAVSDAHGGENTYTWVRDYDPDASLVYFDVDGDGDRGTFQQPYALADDGTAALSGERQEVTPRTTYVPVSPAGQSTTTEESRKGTKMPEIEEARLRQLEADAGRVQTVESERDTLARALAESRARNAATTRARASLAESTLPSVAVDRVVESVTATVPLTDAGQLDEAALDTAVTEARTAEEAYIASIAEANGAGRVRGLGGDTGDASTGVDINESIARAFQHQRQPKGA